MACMAPGTRGACWPMGSDSSSASPSSSCPMSTPDPWRDCSVAWISAGWSVPWPPRAPICWPRGRSTPRKHRLQIGHLLLALVEDEVAFELFQVGQHGLGESFAVPAIDEFDQAGMRDMRAAAGVGALIDGGDQG